MSTDDLNRMVKEYKVPVYRQMVEKEEMIYIPAGWLLCERVVNGTLLYGARKSVFFRSDGTSQKYALARECLSKAGNDVSKMDMVEKLLG